MKVNVLVLLLVAFVSNCSKNENELLRERVIKEAKSKPLLYPEQECFVSNIVGKWKRKFKYKPLEETECVWIFLEDGKIKSEGSDCLKVATDYEIKRMYSEVFNAYLDIKVNYDPSLYKIVSSDKSCENNGEVMLWGQGLEKGGHTFYRVKETSK